MERGLQVLLAQGGCWGELPMRLVPLAMAPTLLLGLLACCSQPLQRCPPPHQHCSCQSWAVWEQRQQWRCWRRVVQLRAARVGQQWQAPQVRPLKRQLERPQVARWVEGQAPVLQQAAQPLPDRHGRQPRQQQQLRPRPRRQPAAPLTPAAGPPSRTRCPHHRSSPPSSAA